MTFNFFQKQWSIKEKEFRKLNEEKEKLEKVSNPSAATFSFEKNIVNFFFYLSSSTQSSTCS